MFHLQKALRTYFTFMIVLLSFSQQAKSQVYDAFDLKKDGVGLCPGGQIRIYIDPNPNYVFYSWEILRPNGWSAIPNSNSPTVSHNEALPYRLKVIDVNGIVMYSKQLDVVMLGAPQSIITPSPNVNQICQGDEVKLNANQISTAFYRWEYNNTTLIDDGLQLTAKKAGTYRLYVTDENSCTTASEPYTLTYFSTIVVQLNTVPTICGLNAVPFNLQGSPAGGEYRGAGITDKTLGTFNPAVAGVGKHEVAYAVPNTGACPEIVEKITITIADPKATITNDPNKTEFCEGDLVTLKGPIGLTTYNWFLNGSEISTDTEIQVRTSGDYTLKVTDELDCNDTSAPVKIAFFNNSSTSMETVASVCGTDYQPVTLKGSPSGGVFTIDNTTATVFDYKKAGFGKHVIKYKINGVLSCLNSEISQEVYIEALPKLDLGNDIYLPKGNSVTLKGYIGSDYTYAWLPITSLDNPNAPNPVASPNQSIRYTLLVTSPRGCSVKDDIAVLVYDKVYVPTAFSPNGDGQNDKWELSGINNYPDAEIHVYDRWGNVVFYSKGNYTPFDGTNSGNQLYEGTYIYKIVLYPDHPIFQYNGTLTILR